MIHLRKDPTQEYEIVLHEENKTKGKHTNICRGCKEPISVYTHDMTEAEINMNVYVLCTCGEKVSFSLPVI